VCGGSGFRPVGFGLGLCPVVWFVRRGVFVRPVLVRSGFPACCSPGRSRLGRVGPVCAARLGCSPLPSGFGRVVSVWVSPPPVAPSEAAFSFNIHSIIRRVLCFTNAIVAKRQSKACAIWKAGRTNAEDRGSNTSFWSLMTMRPRPSKRIMIMKIMIKGNKITPPARPRPCWLVGCLRVRLPCLCGGRAGVCACGRVSARNERTRRKRTRPTDRPTGSIPVLLSFPVLFSRSIPCQCTAFWPVRSVS